MSATAGERSFAEIAIELALVGKQTLEELLAEAARRGMSPELLAVERGLLTPPELDIVQTMRRPRGVIPGYELLSPLGYGGMGVVYRARQINLARAVAIKTVLMENLGDEKALARFEQEARTLARLAHPHIVTAIDFGRHEGRLYFVMELVEGENVEQLVSRRGPLDAYTACGLVRQAAAALSHAEGQGVIHRDVKPSNMLLVACPAGFPLPRGLPLLKVADFGLALLTEARTVSRLTTQHVAVGSPHYMSPEQLSGTRLDGRSDMYALGASLYHMLAGSPPLSDLSLAQIITAKLHHGLPPIEPLRPDLSPEVSEILVRLTAREPDDRYRDYTELLAALDALPLKEPAATATQSIDIAVATSLTQRSPAATEPRLRAGDSPTKVSSAAVAELRKVKAEASTKKDVPEPPPPSPHGIDRRWLLAAGVGLAAIVVAAVGGALLLRPAPPERTLAPVGHAHPLFAGNDLDPRDWNLSGGLWTPHPREDDEAIVISGEGGPAIRSMRSLPVAPDYRLQLGVALPTAKQALVGFGPCPNDTFLALEIGPDFARVGRQKLQGGLHELATAALPPPRGGGVRHVQLDREANHWWIYVDGNQIAWVPDPEPAAPMLILWATDGKAYFSDLEVQNLGPPEAESPAVKQP